MPPGAGCDSFVTTIADLQAEVNALSTSTTTIDGLSRTLSKAQSALDDGENKTARHKLAGFIRTVIQKSHLKSTSSNLILLDEADSLVCGAANLLLGINLP